MVSNSRHRLPAGHTVGEITKLLQKKENQRLRFKDICEKIGISKPVLSKHLKKLKKDGTVISMKEGREKYYMLSKNAFKILDRHVDIFSSNYSEYIADNLIIRPYSDTEELFSEFSHKMGAILFFTVLKSMETGQDWTKAIDIREFILNALLLIPYFITKEKIPSELLDPLNDEMIKMDFKNIKKYLNRIFKNNTRNKLTPLYDSLQKKYPYEFEVLNHSYKKPQDNWAKHYTDIFERK